MSAIQGYLEVADGAVVVCGVVEWTGDALGGGLAWVIAQWVLGGAAGRVL